MIVGVPREIKPGESAFARIRAREPMVALHGDRFVLRSSDAGTIGGGVVLDVNPPKRSRKEAVEELNILSSWDMKGKALLYIKRGGVNGIAASDLLVKFNAPASVIEPVISELVSSGNAIKTDEGVVSAGIVKTLSDSVASELKEYHKKEPMKEGIQREELRTRLRVPNKILGIAIEKLVIDRLVVTEKDLLKLASHKASGGEVKGRIEKIYIDAALTPPILSELLEKMKIREREALDLLHLLAKEGKLVKVKDMFFSKEAVDSLHTRVVELLKIKGEMSPVDFKEMTGLSRKFAIP